MKVYFIGAGPGAADLITIRGARLLSSVPLVLYAGSLMPEDILVHCRTEARLVNTAKLDLDAQERLYLEAQENDWDVARLHSGDPSIYGAISEQMRRLESAGIEYEVVPGVSSFCGAAATLAAELTRPNVSQTIILTRVSGRASAVPEKEELRNLAAHGATLCIFLSGPHLKKIVDDLLEHYPPSTPIALVYRASWPDERKLESTLGEVLSAVDIREWALTTMMLVGEALGKDPGAESKLYSADYSHRFRTPTHAQ